MVDAWEVIHKKLLWVKVVNRPGTHVISGTVEPRLARSTTEYQLRRDGPLTARIKKSIGAEKINCYARQTLTFSFQTRTAARVGEGGHVRQSREAVENPSSRKDRIVIR